VITVSFFKKDHSGVLEPYLQLIKECIYNTTIKSTNTHACEVCHIKQNKIKKNYWLLKWTFGTDQQEHLEEKRLEIK
jgi:hypothetical protein